MKRLHIIHLLFAAQFILLAACQGEEAADPSPTASATAVVTAAAVATDTPTVAPAAARGEESPQETPRPAASRTPGTQPTAILEIEELSGFGSPFQVRADGFSFRNYGANYPEGDFTIIELRELFGDGVCSRIDGETCIPTAQAQQWIADRNADMDAGHCIGFTVASYRFLEGDLQPAAFAKGVSGPYDIDQQAPIMRTIAANGSLYWVNSVWSSEVSGSPREIIDALLDLGEPVDLSIFLPGMVGGHSLLAYGVEQVAPQTYHILVYDNNFPGKNAYVEVDYQDNTWHYAQGAVNPGAAITAYQGDAATETLRFIPLSAYETADCPFCSAAAEEEKIDKGFTLLSFLGQGEVLVKTALGVIGFVDGEIVNEMPGARFVYPRGQFSADGSPGIILPAGTDDFTVEFNGLERVSSMSSDFSLVLDQLNPAPENSQLDVAVEAKGVAYQAGGAQSPLLSAAVNQEEAAYGIALLGVEFADGQSLSMGAVEGDSGLEIRSQEADTTDATLIIARLTDEGEAIYATTALPLENKEGVVLDVTAWDGSGSIDSYTDSDGDGTYSEQPEELKNEPLGDLLLQRDPADVTNILDAIDPYLGDQDPDAILAALPDQDLSGQDIGQILQPLQLSDEQLIDLILTLSLPVPELAELLFALRLEPARQDALIEGLDLTDADETALWDYLADLALYHEIQSDWAFVDTGELAEFAGLLNRRDLTVDQLAQLLQRMAFTVSEIEEVLADLELPLADLTELAEQLGAAVPASGTVTPTATAVLAAKLTPTAAPIITGTLLLTPVATTTITLTIEAGALPTATAFPAAYPGVDPPATAVPRAYPGPDPTAVPGAYPGADPPATAVPGAYPGPGPAATAAPGAYPGPDPTDAPGAYPGADPAPTAAPVFLSTAFCMGDNLRVIAQEPPWINVPVTIRSDEGVLFSGTTGPNGESFVETAYGPGTWTNLHVEAAVPPAWVSLGTITCPELSP